jgi:hypothetical protein
MEQLTLGQWLREFQGEKKYSPATHVMLSASEGTAPAALLAKQGRCGLRAWG